MNTLTFKGTVYPGVGKHANLVIPGRKDLANGPPDWPEHLQPGSLNILIHDSGYPAEFAQFQPDMKVKNLDSKQFTPALTIPHDQMQGNRLKPSADMPDKGTAQVWRAIVLFEANSVSHAVWVHRRLGSQVCKQLELISKIHLRNTLSLEDGMEVTVELQYEES